MIRQTKTNSVFVYKYILGILSVNTMEYVDIFVLLVLFVLIAVIVYKWFELRETIAKFGRGEKTGEWGRKQGKKGRGHSKKLQRIKASDWNENTTVAKGILYKDLEKHPRSRSEAAVVDYLESITGVKFPTVYPEWLTWKGRKLEMDGYNDELRLAMEFSGPLHTKWNPSEESYQKYFDRIVRDVVKRRLAAKNNIKFFVVDASLPSRHWRNYVLSRLYDFGIEKVRPPDYINEQIVSPFRNKQIERELGLNAEWKAAKAL